MPRGAGLNRDGGSGEEAKQLGAVGAESEGRVYEGPRSSPSLLRTRTSRSCALFEVKSSS
jgi:hypothetical protein